MFHSKPKTEDIMKLVGDVITPVLAVERTMVMPFDRERHMNVGEHSTSLALLGGALAGAIDPTLDTAKITEYAVIHRIVEIHVGDVTVWETDEAIRQKHHDDILAADRILHDFPRFDWIAKKYKEYDMRDTPEKKYVYALDKLYPHILILVGDYHPVRPSWKAYARTEEIAREEVAEFPALLPLFDELCRRFRQKPHFFSTPIPPKEVERGAQP